MITMVPVPVQGVVARFNNILNSVLLWMLPGRFASPAGKLECRCVSGRGGTNNQRIIMPLVTRHRFRRVCATASA